MEPRSGARYCHRIVHPFPVSIREFTSRTHKLLVCFRVFSDDWGVSASCVLRRISPQLNQVVSIVCFEVHPITSQGAYVQGLSQFSLSDGRCHSGSYHRMQDPDRILIFLSTKHTVLLTLVCPFFLEAGLSLLHIRPRTSTVDVEASRLLITLAGLYCVFRRLPCAV